MWVTMLIWLSANHTLSGFDAMPQKNRISLNGMAAYVLNLIDLACTLCALSLGAMELNPLMASVPVMVVYKLVVVGLLAAWLSRRRERIDRMGLRLCTAVYAGMAVYHLVCLILIGGMLW